MKSNKWIRSASPGIRACLCGRAPTRGRDGLGGYHWAACGHCGLYASSKTKWGLGESWERKLRSIKTKRVLYRAEKRSQEGDFSS